jgi:NTE family protein
VGLVLAGGGARGAAHVGVIEVLEELRVPVDFIVGTSMGAIVGGMYASGMSPETMRTQLQRTDWEEAFDDDPPRRDIWYRQKQDDDLPLFKPEYGFGPGGFKTPMGVVAGQKLNFLLSSLLLHQAATKHFDDLPIPFRATAVDLELGELVVLEDGDLATAIRASMAFPVVFTPVEIDGRLLVDGGVLSNLPVDVALEIGADRMIAVDVGSVMEQVEGEHLSAFQIAQRTINVMTKEVRQQRLDEIRDEDVLITPDLEGITTFDGFSKVGLAVDRGTEAARGMADRLRDFSVDEATFERYIDRQRSGARAEDFVLDRIDITGVDKVSPRRIRRELSSRPGQSLSLDTLREDLKSVYQIGELEEVGFEVKVDEDETVLVIDAQEKSWGPWFFRFGAAASSNFDGEGSYAFNGFLRRPNINAYGGEWKTFVALGSVNLVSSDFYQPLLYRGQVFVAPRIFLSEDADGIEVTNGMETLVETQHREAGFDVGLRLFDSGEFRVGVVSGDIEIQERTGALTRTKPNTGGWRVSLAIDRVDNANFPRSGSALDFEYFNSRESLSADLEYRRLYLSAGHAWRMGKWTQVGWLSFGHDLGSEMPDFESFRLGGFLNLSGLQRGEIAGSRMGVIQLITYRQTGSLPTIFGGDLYIGASLEAGNAWAEEIKSDAGLDDLRTSGSVFAGVDTLFGPLYLGYGRSEGGKDELYLFLGRVFGAGRISLSPRPGR